MTVAKMTMTNETWKCVGITYAEGVASTAAKLEQALNRLAGEGYEVRYIFHADPHFVAVAERMKGKRKRDVSEVRQPARTS